MKSTLSGSLFFYSATLCKGEPVGFLIGSYRRNQWLSQKNIADLQLRLFKKSLGYAINNSVFYRNLYKKNNISIDDINSLDEIKLLPTVSKYDLIQNLDAMSTDVSKRISSSTKTTGGSTGQPVKLFKNSIALAKERSATARAYEWAGIRTGDSQLRFWGVPHSKKARIISRITDLAANRKRVSAFNLTDKSLLEYYEKAQIFQPKYIYGYVSVIEQFAKFINENNLRPIYSVKSIITTAEILNNSARELIQKTFNAKVFNEYGCGEVGSMAHECEFGNMHIMSDNLLIEVDETDGNSGEIIVTDFFNRATPLIRYRLGDFATLSDKQCLCGRSFPVIDSIHGRAYDILEMPSGKKMHPESVIYIFEQIQDETNAFKQFQVVQHSLTDIEAKIIYNKNWSDAVAEHLLHELKKKIDQEVNFRITLVEKLPREQSGKMRLVKRNF